MKVIYKKTDGKIIDFIDGEVSGLNPDLAVSEIEGEFIGTETNISELTLKTEIKYISKLEFKNRLKALGKYELASDMFDLLSDDKKDDWLLATCAASDNADLLALLWAIGVTDLSTIFY